MLKKYFRKIFNFKLFINLDNNKIVYYSESCVLFNALYWLLFKCVEYCFVLRLLLRHVVSHYSQI